MAAGDLCALPEVKDWLSIDLVDLTADAMLSRLITSCSAAIKTWLGRDLNQATYTETQNGSGTTRMSLLQFPVTAVTSVTVNGLQIPAATSPTAYGFLFDKFGIDLVNAPASGPLSPAGTYWFGSFFPAGNLNVQVVYTAGFATVPTDIVQACIEFVAFKFNQRKHVGKKSESLSTGGQSTSFQEGNMPPEVAEMLDQYRSVAVP